MGIEAVVIAKGLLVQELLAQEIVFLEKLFFFIVCNANLKHDWLTKKYRRGKWSANWNVITSRFFIRVGS